jgi:hypothetical protein
MRKLSRSTLSRSWLSVRYNKGRDAKVNRSIIQSILSQFFRPSTRIPLSGQAMMYTARAFSK